MREKRRSHEVGGRVKDKTIRGGCYNAFITSVTLLVICLSSIVWTKLSWVFEFWNKVLVSKMKIVDVKICFWKFRVIERLLDDILKRGWELMTCHLFLDNFSWNLWPLDFKRLNVGNRKFFVLKHFESLQIIKHASALRRVWKYSLSFWMWINFATLSFLVAKTS